jgi:uncharacterized membrane protein (UPF0127 family)
MGLTIRNQTREKVVCEEACLADSFCKRAKGLMFTSRWEGLDGLLLSPCRSIHTMGMRMQIDVCFLDAEHRVLKALACLGPWRLAHGGTDSQVTLELPAGTLERTGTRVGDRLVMDQPEKRGCTPSGSVEGSRC